MDKIKPLQQNLPISDSEDLRLKQKCKDLKRKIQLIEAENEIKAVAVSRSKYAIKRLRFEYLLLLEMLEKKTLLNSAVLNSNQLTSLLDDSYEFNEDNLDLNDLNALLSNSPLSNLKSNDFTLANLLTNISQNRNINLNTRGNNSRLPLDGSAAANSGTNQTAGATTGKRRRGGPGALKKLRAKDPSIPKRPTNAYLIFCDLKKEQLKKEIEENKISDNSENLTTDLSKAMTEAWKKLNDEERKPYYELYEQDRLRYHRELEVYSQKLKKEQGAADNGDGNSNENGNGEATAKDSTDPATTIESTPLPEGDEDEERYTKKIKTEGTEDPISEMEEVEEDEEDPETQVEAPADLESSVAPEAEQSQSQENKVEEEKKDLDLEQEQEQQEQAEPEQSSQVKVEDAQTTDAQPDAPAAEESTAQS